MKKTQTNINISKGQLPGFYILFIRNKEGSSFEMPVDIETLKELIETLNSEKLIKELRNA